VDGWTIALVLGLVSIVVLLGLLVVVTIMARRLAAKTQEVMAALADVQAKTAAIAQLEGAVLTDADGGAPAPDPDDLSGRTDPP
jgi:hypothetical protein